MFQNKKFKRRVERGDSLTGFILLYAVIFIASSLSISLGLSGLVITQIQLAGAGRDSQFAFYAADTGAECAIYWDRSADAFATSSQSTITCAGDSVKVGGSEINSFSLSLANGACANITVDKSSQTETVITSIGRSPCEGRKIERGLEVRY